MSEGYNSFYGGRRGASFVIVKKYGSIEEMIECFQQGGSYKTVNYDEYVLIDTENKNDADNGKVFRRGYDYMNSVGGAVFIGQIVGPAGLAPHTELKTISEVRAIAETEDFTYRRGEGSYESLENLVPGRYKDDSGNWVYNDAIQWAYCSVRDKNSHESTAHIGFKFPYTLFEIEGGSVDPYYNRDSDTENFVNKDLVERTDDMSHPFFQSWKISVPKGIHGDSLKNFRAIAANDSIEDYDGKSDDVQNKRKILVYDYYNYDKYSTGEPVSLYLGDYNMIKDILLTDEGTLTIEYTHDDTDVYNKLLKWIKSVQLDTETGHLIVKYNQTDASGKDTYETDLDWIKDVIVDEDGTITFDYTKSENRVLNKRIKYIKEVSLIDGHFKITFNQEVDAEGNPTTYETDLDWVTGLTIDENGVIKVQHVNGTEESLSSEVKWITETTLAEDGTLEVAYNNGAKDTFTKAIRWISNISLAEDGTFTIKYNNGLPDYVQHLKWPTSLSVNTGEVEGEGSQKLNIEYNDGTSTEVGNPLNYVMRTAVENGHLLCLYSDPARRAAIVSAHQNYTYDNRNDWHDLGVIISNSGILTGKYYNVADYPQLDTVTHTIAFLNEEYPNGLTGEQLEGKTVSVGDSDSNKDLYAFDYTAVDGTYKGWYYLGKLSIENVTSIVGKENDTSLLPLLENLPANGIWFIQEEV